MQIGVEQEDPMTTNHQSRSYEQSEADAEFISSN
jgi:hypothetical protein